MLHGQFTMEVFVLIPEMEHAVNQRYTQNSLYKNGTKRLDGSLQTGGKKGHHHIEKGKQIKRNVIGLMVLGNIVEGQLSIIDISQIGLVIDKTVAQQGNSDGTDDGHQTIDDSTSTFSQSPRPDAHQ